MVHAMRLLLLAALSLFSTTQAYVIKIRTVDGDVQEHEVPSSNLTAEEFLSGSKPVRYRREVGKREAPCIANPHVEHYYKKVGDGNPHQNYKIAQIASTSIACPGTVTAGEEHTFGWSIGGSINPGVNKWDFATLGFSVEQSDTKTVQDFFSCDGKMTDICALHYTAVTAITVDFFQSTNTCGMKTEANLGRGVVYLPNANGIGSTISRGANFADPVIIQCRGTATREVNFYCGPKGGPEWFDNRPIGPWTAAYLTALDPPGCQVPMEALKFSG